MVDTWEYTAHLLDFETRDRGSAAARPTVGHEMQAGVEQLIREFNDLGVSGWEAMGVIDITATGVGPRFPVMLFKRHRTA